MRCLVTGAGGFVGLALARELRAAGHEVIGLSRQSYPELDSLGVVQRQADLADGAALGAAVQGVETVFHVASRVGLGGSYREFFQTNVIGTRHLLTACRDAGVRRFIYTSSPSVVAGSGDLRGINEEYPYPSHYEAHYPATKALAEREVIAADAPDGLRTIALRPHLIFGPGDRQLVPRLVARAQAGRLVQVGAGSNRSDFTYIEDCVAAHIAADVALRDTPAVGGQPYFISQGDPVPLWWWVNEVLRYNGLPPVTRRVSHRVARIIGAALEGVWGVLPLAGEPPLTRFLASEMATDHYFCIDRARTQLGYRPRWTVAQALEMTFSSRTATASNGLKSFANHP